MAVTVYPARVSGKLRAIDSKSHAHRLLICAALCEGSTRVGLRALSGDINSTITCLRALGAGVQIHEGEALISGVPDTISDSEVNLNVGESAATYRFLMSVVCALGARARFTLGGRLYMRPVGALADAITSHGARVTGIGTRDVRVSGRLVGGEYNIVGDVSSQYISALMLALALIERESVINIHGEAQSRGYIELTRRALNSFGVNARIESGAAGERVYIPSGRGLISPGLVGTEGDWSSAAIILACAAACGGEMRVYGLNADSAQPDRAILNILERFGARVEFASGEARVRAGALAGCDVDISGCPDLAPALAILGVKASGETVIKRAARLRLKESDRVESITRALTALGARAWANENDIHIRGGAPLAGGCVDSAGDHRVVMMAACLAPLARAPVIIQGADAVCKSYPEFFEDMRRLGLRVSDG